MTRKNEGGLVVLSTKVHPVLADQVKLLAAESNETVSSTIVRLLREALEDGAGARIKRDLEDEGYQDGLRRGLHEARAHMKKLYR